MDCYQSRRALLFGCLYEQTSECAATTVGAGFSDNSQHVGKLMHVQLGVFGLALIDGYES
jgi:hypothetical protein